MTSHSCLPRTLVVLLLLSHGLPPAPSCAASASGASASRSDDRHAGVVLEVEAWWAAPRNLDLDYAFIDPSGGLSGGGNLNTLGYDRQGEPRITVGWDFGGSGGPVALASFWEIESEAESKTGLHPGSVGALLASPDFAIGRSLVDRARAQGTLRGTLVDATLCWTTVLGESAELGFAIGLRSFRFEQQVTVAYAARSFGTEMREFVNTATDARGIGPLGEVAFGYRFGRDWVVRGSLGLALPVGDLDGEVTDSAFVEGRFDRATVVSRPDVRRTYLHVEGEVRVEARISARVRLSLAYSYVHWSAVALSQRFVDDVSQNSTIPTEQDVVFEGPSINLALRF